MYTTTAGESDNDTKIRNIAFNNQDQKPHQPLKLGRCKHQRQPGDLKKQKHYRKTKKHRIREMMLNLLNKTMTK